MYFYPMYVDDALIRTIAPSKQDRAVYRHAAAAHQRHDAPPDATPRESRRTRKNCSTSMRAAHPESRAPHDVHHRLPRRDRRAVRRDWSSSSTKQRFQHAGVFTYSYEADTPSAKLPDHIDDAVKEARRERVMAAQQEVAFAYNESQVGKTLDVLLDMPVEGRTRRLDRPQLGRRSRRRRRRVS